MTKFDVQKCQHIVAIKGTKGKPSPEDLEAINTLTLEELGEDDVYVRTFYVAHNAIDRDRECIDEDLLEQLAESLPGKGVFIKHPMSWDGDAGPGEGRWFAARTVEMSFDKARKELREPKLRWPPDVDKAVIIEAKSFLLAVDENETFRKKIDAGIVADVSLGFNHSGRVEIRDDDGDVIAHRLAAPGESYEASFVWLGAQPGARAHKHKNPNSPDEPPEDTTVDPKELKQHAEKHGLKVLTDDEVKQEKVTAVTEFIEDLAEKGEGEDDIKSLVKQGREYRDGLVDQVVKVKRQKGMLDDDNEAVEAEKEKLRKWGTEELKHFAESFGETGGTQLGGDDPNADRSAKEGGLRDESATKQALGTAPPTA